MIGHSSGDTGTVWMEISRDSFNTPNFEGNGNLGYTIHVSYKLEDINNENFKEFWMRYPAKVRMDKSFRSTKRRQSRLDYKKTELRRKAVRRKENKKIFWCFQEERKKPR